MTVLPKRRPGLVLASDEYSSPSADRPANGHAASGGDLLVPVLMSPCDGLLTVADQTSAQRPKTTTFENMISINPAMRDMFELIGRVARTATTVLIEGETGTGKELVARAIHRMSPRRGALVAVSCAAIPELLLESELFGHEVGSFTGAARQRKGRFELAEGGTLFLDEIGDLPQAAQCKLLRILQERKFERVGGGRSINVNVRVVAATNRCLKQMVQDGSFRADLYYRLNVVKVDLPPLRQRPEDIRSLAVHFTQKFARLGESAKRITPSAMTVLQGYDWPGNVRELENVIERACVCSRRDKIRAEDLPSDLVAPALVYGSYSDESPPLPDAFCQAAAVVEQQYILAVLKIVNGNVEHCAKLCGLTRQTTVAKLTSFEGRVLV